MSREDLLKSFSVFAPRNRARAADEVHADAMSRGAQCHRCVLFGQRRGPVKGEIRKNARLTIIGEAPGNIEVQQDRVWAWKSGDELERALVDGGLERSDCTVINCTECQPPYDMKDFVERTRRNPPVGADGQRQLDPITACRPRLLNDIKASGATTVLAVGAQALEAVAYFNGLPYADRKASREGKELVSNIMLQHGAPITTETGIICSALHPAFAMREWGYRQEVRRDIARAARIAIRGHVDWTEPTGVTFPDIGQLSEILARMRRAKRLTVDIETDGIDIMRARIRCIGIAGVVDGVRIAVCVPIRWTDGRWYWPGHTQSIVHEWVRDLLAYVPLLFHNANYDVLVLEREGFILPPEERKLSNLLVPDDTLLMDRNTRANGLPHNLGTVAKRYFEVRLWKFDVDHKASDGTTDDRVLHKYNINDIVITDMLGDALEPEVNACGTRKTYEIDRKLAAVAREMTSLGIPIDEEYRGLLSNAYNKEKVRLRQELRDTLGWELNPRSSPQVGDWLFVREGLTPPINTGGKKYAEGDDWATSVPALFALLETGVRPELAKAIKLVLDCRTCETIQTRYVNGLRTYYDDATRDLGSFGYCEPIRFAGDEIIPRRPKISIAHSVWNVGTTPTGRWTSRPNWQNAPARAWAVALGENLEREAINIRRLVIAPPGHVLVGADFDQAELRLYACVAEDEMLLDGYAKGLDAHTFNLATMTSKNANDIPRTYDSIVDRMKNGSPDEKSKLKFLRTVAKRMVFLIIYGGALEKLYSTLKSERDKSSNEQTFPAKDLPKQRTQVWYDRWHEFHPWTRGWHAKVDERLRARGYVTDFKHDRRRFYDDGVSNDTSHYNHEIQTASGSLANEAVLQIAEEIPFRKWSPWTGLLVQVHDQLVVCVPEAYGERAKAILKDAMTSEYPGGIMQFSATPHISTNLARQDY